MAYQQDYIADPMSRAEVDTLAEPLLLEFGTPWCGYCRGAQLPLQQSLELHPELRHIKIEDGPGRRLGRSFGVRLWPTLILLRGGIELARVVRPQERAPLDEALAALRAGA